MILPQIGTTDNVMGTAGTAQLERFAKSTRKAGYLYIITPKGQEHKTRVSYRFLKRKIPIRSNDLIIFPSLCPLSLLELMVEGRDWPHRKNIWNCWVVMERGMSENSPKSWQEQFFAERSPLQAPLWQETGFRVMISRQEQVISWNERQLRDEL